MIILVSENGFVPFLVRLEEGRVISVQRVEDRENPPPHDAKVTELGKSAVERLLAMATDQRELGSALEALVAAHV